jgi:hypothetical protein
MPVKEKVTQQRVINALEIQNIGSSTTTAGAIIDSADFDIGVYFALAVSNYTDGTYTLKIEHGDDSGLSDAADVDSAMLVYGTLPALSAALAEGAYLPREGVHSTKRYLRASIVSTGVTTGADAQVLAIVNPELVKTAQQ